MSFSAPWFLLGLLAVPVLVWAYWARERTRAAAGAAFVTRTTPVAESAARVPLKFVEVETLMPVVFAGTASGVMVALAPRLTLVSG